MGVKWNNTVWHRHRVDPDLSALRGVPVCRCGDIMFGPSAL